MAEETEERSVQEMPPQAAARSTGASSAVIFLLFLLPAFGTVVFGAVDQMTWAVFYVFWALLMVLWLVDARARGGLAINVSSLLLPLAGVLLIGLVQLVPISFIGSLDPAATFFFDLRTPVYLTFFAACLTFIDGESRLRKAVNFVIIFGAAMAFYGILQRLASPQEIYGMRRPAFAQPFGPFVNQHHFAAFMEMTGGLTLGLLFGETTSRDRRILLTIAVIIMGSAVAFTGSRGGLLSFGAVLAFVVLFRLLGRGAAGEGRRKKLALAAAGLGLVMMIFMLVLFLGGNDPLLRGTGVGSADLDVSTGRFHFWPIALKIFFAHPIFGAGFDSFGTAFTQYDTWPGIFRVEQAHNDYLQSLADGGIAAFACVVAFVVLLFRKGLAVIATTHDYRKHAAVGALAGCFGILVHSFFDFPLRTHSNVFFFLLLATIATVPVKIQQRRRKRSRHFTEQLQSPSASRMEA